MIYRDKKGYRIYKNGKRHMKSFSKNKYKDAKERAIKYRKNNTKHYKRKNIIHIIHKI